MQRPDGLWEFQADTIDQHIDAFLGMDRKAESTRWGMAAIAASIETKYGESRVEEFAEKVQYTPRHVRRIARVYRAAIEKGQYCPDLSFHHHIEALSYSDPKKALAVALKEALSSIALARWIKDQSHGQEEAEPRERFTERHQTEGERLVEVLRVQVEEFPQFADDLNHCIERVIAHAKRTRAKDRESVVKLLKQWEYGLTTNEIMEDARLSHWDVRQILSGLIKAGLVVEKPEPREKLSPACWRYIYALKR